MVMVSDALVSPPFPARPAVAGNWPAGAGRSRRAPPRLAARTPARSDGGSRKTGSDRDTGAMSVNPLVQIARSRSPPTRSCAPPACPPDRRRPAGGKACWLLVVWAPWPVTWDTAWMRISRSGSSALISDDLPTPDCPTSRLTRPRSQARSSLMPPPFPARPAVAGNWPAGAGRSRRAPPRLATRTPARSDGGSRKTGSDRDRERCR